MADPNAWRTARGLPVENYWYAERDPDPDFASSPWRPVLQCTAFAPSMSVWFETQAQCEQFIRDEILGARVHFEAIPDNIVWVSVKPADGGDIHVEF